MFLKKKDFEIGDLKKKISAMQKKLELLNSEIEKINNKIEILSRKSLETALEFQLRYSYTEALFNRRKNISMEVKKIENQIDKLKSELLVLTGEKKLMEKYIQKQRKILDREEEKKEMRLLDEVSNRNFTPDF